MDKYSYRFTVACLGVSILMLSAASIVLVVQDKNPIPLVPVLAPIVTGLVGLLVSPPKQSSHNASI
ncbi:hypothetical protein [Microcoleus asticus]|uniref:Uncharacterized protein n=1 Tax=Microcoleus asticus IPMA8 TaxID=2563858 RepID=A0ABX2D4I9_9CYAN|nr:hypothetical protein [Microcoleus asticus]NQE37539.1 hypothetical protein [Microcoleus asticus IPMA8]